MGGREREWGRKKSKQNQDCAVTIRYNVVIENYLLLFLSLP